MILYLFPDNIRGRISDNHRVDFIETITYLNSSTIVDLSYSLWCGRFITLLSAQHHSYGTGIPDAYSRAKGRERRRSIVNLKMPMQGISQSRGLLFRERPL